MKRTLKGGQTTYYAKYVDNEGKQRMRLAGRLKKDAESYLTDLKKERKDQREGYLKPAPDMKTTLRQWCVNWVETVDVRDHTRAEYRRLLLSDVGLVERFGDLPLGMLQRSDVRTWMAERASVGASRNTIRNALAPVRAALADALEDRKILENPAAIARRKGRRSAIPGKPPLRVTAHSPALVNKLVETADPRFRAILLLAASCGLRCGEIYGLRWNDISADNRIITVARSNNRGVISETKTDAGNRTVPLFASAREALLEHRIASPFTNPDDLIFPDALGNPAYASHANDREFQATFKAAGLPRRHFRFHALRHYAVSQLIEQGANIVLLSKIAGHSSPDITLRVYSHLMPTGASDAADKFDPVTIAL